MLQLTPSAQVWFFQLDIGFLNYAIDHILSAFHIYSSICIQILYFSSPLCVGIQLLNEESQKTVLSLICVWIRLWTYMCLVNSSELAKPADILRRVSRGVERFSHGWLHFGTLSKCCLTHRIHLSGKSNSLQPLSPPHYVLYVHKVRPSLTSGLIVTEILLLISLADL